MDQAWSALEGEDVEVAARCLLGCELSSGGVVVRLTEVEAYAGVGADPASHAHRGRTPRNQVMFGPSGYAYVYYVFGMHWCLNVVCGPVGAAAAVLLRAGEVIAGAEIAQQRRGGGQAFRDLARGPARLTVALGVDRQMNATSLIDGSGPMHLVRRAERGEALAIETGPRVGVREGADTSWRFWLRGDPTVSVYRKHAPRRR